MMNFNIEEGRRYCEQSSEELREGCTRRGELEEDDELVASRIDSSSKTFPFPSTASSSGCQFSNKNFIYGAPAPATDLSLGSTGMLNGEETRNPVTVEKEHMFDKVVTPSDVGKLNRLVIPKQHAEKYFPLDSSSNEKGLLLNFEDRNGKPWRFRYSYWNSSQSYVMTKGWSRFVKEKKLDAGDIVSFQRGVGEESSHRLFIDWRRRPSVSAHLEFQNQMNVRWGNRLLYSLPHLQHQHPPPPQFNYSLTSYNAQYQFYGRANAAPYYVNPNPPITTPIAHDRSPMVIDSVPVVQGRTVGKRLRLFGVNMDCPIKPSGELGDEDISSFHLLGKIASSSSLPPDSENANNFQFPGGSSLQLRLPSGSGVSMSAVQSHELSKKGKIPLSFDLDP